MRLPLSLLLAACVLAVPLNSTAQNALGDPSSGSQSPVTINSCQPMLDQPAPAASPNPNPLLAILQPSTSTGIRIQFTNESNKTADLVNFDVESNGSHFVIRDVGTFSPGISIDHRYSNGRGQAYVLPAFIAPNIHCRVASVRFVDRTVWPPPATAASAAAIPPNAGGLSANPAAVVIETIADSALFMVSANERVAGFKESDNCDGIASIFVSATAQTSAAYTVKPLAAGHCTATINDEAGRSIAVPIAVQ